MSDKGPREILQERMDLLEAAVLKAQFDDSGMLSPAGESVVRLMLSEGEEALASGNVARAWILLDRARRFWKEI